MFLSKVKLSWAQAKNPHEQHRALWKLFPNRQSEERTFLYRVEQLVRGQGAVVLMQSINEPVGSASPELLAVKELPLNLEKGQRVRFRLRVNPIKSVKDENKGKLVKNGKTFLRTSRVPLIKEEEQQAWLERKIEGIATIEALIIQPEMPLNFRKVKERYSGKIQPLLFDGIFSVDDPEALIVMMQNGIGPAKAFGCGMLSLAPA